MWCIQVAAVKGSFAAEISLLSSPNSYVHWTILQYTRQQFDVRACWEWPLWHEQKFTWQLGSDQSTGSQVHRFGISAVQVLVFDRFTGSAYQQYRFWCLTSSQVWHIGSTGVGDWQVHRFCISAVSTGFCIWQVHRFGNILLIRVAGRGKERRS